MQRDLIAVVTEFLKVLQSRTSFGELKRFYHADAIQIEYPNTLTKHLTTRNLSELKTASDRGLQVLQKESYEVINSFALDNTVIVEVIWRGTLSIALGNIYASEEMKAYFAQFFEFKDGLIISQRNYDCFEPFD